MEKTIFTNCTSPTLQSSSLCAWSDPVSRMERNNHNFHFCHCTSLEPDRNASPLNSRLTDVTFHLGATGGLMENKLDSLCQVPRSSYFRLLLSHERVGVSSPSGVYGSCSVTLRTIWDVHVNKDKWLMLFRLILGLICPECVKQLCLHHVHDVTAAEEAWTRAPLCSSSASSCSGARPPTEPVQHPM